jgi:hypothetical protein
MVLLLATKQWGNLARTFSKLDFKVCPFIIFVSYLMLQLFAAVAAVVVGQLSISPTYNTSGCKSYRVTL